MRQPTLAVIGQHNDVTVRQLPLEFGQLGPQHFMRRRGFEIDTQQLLLSADDA